MEIIATTDSCNEMFERPVIKVKCVNFSYVDVRTGHHGLQIDSKFKNEQKKVMQLCSEISDRMHELHSIINQNK